jgi:hypothetical protein
MQHQLDQHKSVIVSSDLYHGKLHLRVQDASWMHYVNYLPGLAS